MFLEKIEIKGFKSFAEKTVLHFPKENADTHAITAIVGPNGSGKSNISDAIRWVLGEQSLKTLRGKKSEDVIFSGSDKKARLGFAEVSLYLNNESGRAPIEYSEIVLTRRLYRNGEGEYLLNKNKVRLIDLHILLAKAQIGQRTYSVIGQGMIDYFLIAPPHERKEFFDEAAGVKEYQIKKNQSVNKLLNTNENLKKAELVLQEIEPRLRSLTRQMKKLKKREGLLTELKKFQNDYYGTINSNLKTKKNGIRENLNGLDESQNKLTSDLNSIESEMSELKNQQTRTKTFEDLGKRYNSLIEERNLLLRKQTVIKANKEIEYKKIGKIDLIWLEKKQDEIKREKENISDSVKQIAEDIIALTKNIANFDETKNELEGRKREKTNAARDLTISSRKDIDGEGLKQDLFSIHEAYKAILSRLKTANSSDDIKIIIEEANSLEKRFSSILNKFKNEPNNKEELAIIEQELEEINARKETIAISLNNLMLEINTKREREKLLIETNRKIEAEAKNIIEEISNAKAAPGNNRESVRKLEKENEEIEKTLLDLNHQIMEIKKEIDEFNNKEEVKKEKLFNLQKQYQNKQLELNELAQKINYFNVELAKIDTKLEDLRKEAKENNIDPPPVEFSIIEEPQNLLPMIRRIKEQLEFIGGIDPETKKEYSETKERFEFLDNQTKDLREAMLSLETIIKELDATIKGKFEKAFNAINDEFQKYFKILFEGGKSSLIKITEEDEGNQEQETYSQQQDNANGSDSGESVAGKLEKPIKQNNVNSQYLIKNYKQKAVFGIEILACPPGKKVNSINMLSGGERALTAIALLCAIISNNPSPFIVLDEVDAALDEANSHKLANILENLSHKSQFIIITHNRSTMQKAKLLYGISMGDDGISKLLSIKFEKAKKGLKN